MGAMNSVEELIPIFRLEASSYKKITVIGNKHLVPPS